MTSLEVEESESCNVPYVFALLVCKSNIVYHLLKSVRIYRSV